jgi:hypothetical protein
LERVPAALVALIREHTGKGGMEGFVGRRKAHATINCGGEPFAEGEKGWRAVAAMVDVLGDVWWRRRA